jgi:glycosyltransferase involved in cell wall biosynthesis
MKLTLIMRCRNRIEYTLQVLNALAKQRHAPPFDVVLVDNASTDGTPTVVDWLMKNPGTRRWFPPVKVVSLDENVGDFGGMIEGAKHVPEDSTLVGQIDNDIYVPPAGVALCCTAADSGRVGVATLKRKGFSRAIPTTGTRYEIFDVGGTRGLFLPVPHAVAFYVMRRQSFDNQIGRANHCRELTSRVGQVHKAMNVFSVQIEGADQDGEGSYLQHQKYALSEITERLR